jgi:hypothetical protein
MRRLALLLAPLAALGLVVAACGDDASTVSSGGSTSSTSSTSTSTSSTEATTTTVTDGGGTTPTTTRSTTPPAPQGTVAIEISVGGGFSPQGLDFSSVPTIVLADGRAYVGGAQTMQYPGPALAPVSTGDLGKAAVDRLLASARSAGLDGGLTDFGTPGVTDLPSTTVRVLLDGKVHTTSVYALGSEGDGAGGVSARQRANRQKVADFVGAVGDAATAAATAPLTPSGYEVLGFPTDAGGAVEGEPAPNHLDWPFTDLRLDPSTCARITGDRVAPFAKLLERASSITVWHAGGATYRLSIRATLPGRTDCP